MRRREFLAATAGLGVSLAVSRVASARGAEKAASPGGRLSPPAKGLIQVACAISSGTTDIDWVGPEASFSTWHRDEAGKPAPKFKVFTVGEKLEPYDGRIPDYTFGAAPPANVVLVPAQRGSEALLEWLRKSAASCDVLMSVCTGAWHLAKAGLLNGRRATTHHEAVDRFMKEFPEVHWVRGVRYVDEGKIATGGGLTAGIDLGLHVVERYLGRDAAQRVADHLEYGGKGWLTPGA